MIGFAELRAASCIRGAIVAFIGLCMACPVALAQETLEQRDVSFVRTEGPRETFGSFLRLKDELETSVSSYLQDHSSASKSGMETPHDPKCKDEVQSRCQNAFTSFADGRA